MAKNVFPSTPPKRERKTTTGDTGQTKAPTGKSTSTSNPRNLQMWGWGLVFLSLYMMGAFVWYLFTGAADQSVVDSAFSTKMRVSAGETKNVMGFFGLLLSHFFIFRWFGVAALGFPFLLFLFGYKIARKRELLPLQRTTQVTLAYIFWVSLFFGFLGLTNWFYPALQLFVWWHWVRNQRHAESLYWLGWVVRSFRNLRRYFDLFSRHFFFR
jgi:S-DNA-T family DNA segregation ATPase FtsK/SpoIIIE